MPVKCSGLNNWVKLPWFGCTTVFNWTEYKRIAHTLKANTNRKKVVIKCVLLFPKKDYVWEEHTTGLKNYYFCVENVGKKISYHDT